MANLIAAVTDVSVTPEHIKPGDSVTIAVSLTAGSRKITSLQCALYGAIDGVNYLVTPLVAQNVNIAANATATVTFTATASAQNAQVDDRITAFAAGANNSIHDVPLLLGFRTVESNITSGGSGDFQEETASVGQFLYGTETAAGAFGKHYNPTIVSLNIERASYDAVANVFRPDDEGVRALVSCVLSMDDPQDGQHFPCVLAWGNYTAAICHSHGTSIHNRSTDRWSYADRAWFGEGMTRNIWPLFDYEFPKGTDTIITCTYGDDYESDTVVFVLRAAFANINLSGTGKGVAIGKFSASTEEQPLLEVAEDYKSVFYGDVIVMENTLIKVVSVSASGNMGTGTTTMSKTITVDAGDGYTPIGIVGFRTSNSNCIVYRAQLDGSNVEMSCRYSGSSSSTSITLTADVLCLHTEL